METPPRYPQVQNPLPYSTLQPLHLLHRPRTRLLRRSSQLHTPIVTHTIATTLALALTLRRRRLIRRIRLGNRYNFLPSRRILGGLHIGVGQLLGGPVF